jgi:exodeoxyribonuclease-3
MLKISTWNVNGVRARKSDVLAWLAQEKPDFLCLQEVKASPEQVPEELASLFGYHGYWHGHKGYSGVALLVSQAAFPERPQFAHPTFDHETRIVTAEVESSTGRLRVASIYVPNGGKDFGAKMRFLIALAEYAEEARRDGVQLVLCGDLNVAREQRDVHPTLQNAEQIGQTAEERALLERIIAAGLVDLSRKFYPDDDRLFSWWAPWRNMRARNIGWRLDYVLAAESLAQHAQRCDVLREFGTSDHGPVLVDLDLPIARAPLPEQRPTSPPPGQLGFDL